MARTAVAFALLVAALCALLPMSASAVSTNKPSSHSPTLKPSAAASTVKPTTHVPTRRPTRLPTSRPTPAPTSANIANIFDVTGVSRYLTESNSRQLTGSFCFFTTDATGAISYNTNYNFTAWIAASPSSKAYLCVSNYGVRSFDKKAAEAIITQPSVTTTFIKHVNALCDKFGFVGVTIDFEALAPGDRDNFTTFVTSAAAGFSAHNLDVHVIVAAVDNATQLASSPYDYAKLSQHANFLQINTIDYSVLTSTQPGPIASKPYLNKVLTFARSVASANKLCMTLPAFGGWWNTADNTKNGVLTWVAAESASVGATVTYDATTATSSFAYTANVTNAKNNAWSLVNRIAYVESAQGLAAKAALATSLGLNCIAVSDMGQEDHSYWVGLLGR